jgi:hypothetical protein
MMRFMTSRIRAAQKAGLIDENIHAPSLAWLYLLPATGEAWIEAAGLELPPQDEWLALLERVAQAVAAPGAIPAGEASPDRADLSGSTLSAG